MRFDPSAATTARTTRNEIGCQALTVSLKSDQNVRLASIRPDSSLRFPEDPRPTPFRSDMFGRNLRFPHSWDRPHAENPPARNSSRVSLRPPSKQARILTRLTRNRVDPRRRLTPFSRSPAFEASAILKSPPLVVTATRSRVPVGVPE